jgi:phosphoadenosine phosphosulfate reductase
LPNYSLESHAISFLTQTINDNTVVSFSGGKDSLVALDLAYRLGLRKAVFCDTSIEFPETNVYVDEVADFYGIEIDIVQPPIDFFKLIELVTSPSRRQRWCCDVLKFGPLSAWAIKNGIGSFITGLRRDESKGRAEYMHLDRNPLVPVRQINPIIDWTERDVWEYIERYNLPTNPLYSEFSRVGCWCCPFKTKNEWKKMEELYPKDVERLNSNLHDLAKRLEIKNIDEFVYKRGWTYWIHSSRKVTVGVSTLCGKGNYTDIVLEGNNSEDTEAIMKMLPIITNDYRKIGKKLRISISNSRKTRVHILVERAINCIGCGACIAYCKEGALFIDNGKIAVDTDICTNCHKCLDARTLKGSCIARHYSPRRAYILRNETLAI